MSGPEPGDGEEVSPARAWTPAAGALATLRRLREAVETREGTQGDTALLDRVAKLLDLPGRS